MSYTPSNTEIVTEIGQGANSHLQIAKAPMSSENSPHYQIMRPPDDSYVKTRAAAALHLNCPKNRAWLQLAKFH